MKTMKNLRAELAGEATVIRYKDHVICSEFVSAPHGEWFTASIWTPVETEAETGYEYEDLRLENNTPWDPASPDAQFDTEGEALFAAMQAADQLTIYDFDFIR